MTREAWWRKKKQKDHSNNQEGYQNKKDNQSSSRYFINKTSLENQETASTSNYRNNSRGFNFDNSSIPNSFNFNNNYKGSKQPLRWNGNRSNYLNTSKNNFNSKETGTNDVKKPVNKAMTNRYFSIENKINDDLNIPEGGDLKLDENENSKETNIENKIVEQQENEQFIKKRDYLIKKLLQSRNLPDPSATDNQLTSNLESTSKDSQSEETNSKIVISEKKGQSIEPSENVNELVNLQAKAPTTTPAFQEDFIPLFSTNKENEKNPKPEQNQESNDEDENDYEEIVLESYDTDEKDEDEIIDLTNNNDIIEVFNSIKKGPYPVKCLTRANQYLIGLIKPNSVLLNKSNYEDRIFEILKLKLKLPSKFDNDKRLHRQIVRDSRSAKEKIHEKLIYINKRTNNFNPNFSGSTSTHIRFDLNEKRQQQEAKKPVYIELSDDSDNDSNNSDDSTTRNFEDVIEMIKGNEFECLLESDDSNSDSRCHQLGKYSKKKTENIKTKSSLDNKLSPRLRKASSVDSNKKSIEHRGGSNSNRLEDALDNLEQKYKSVRNKRNKLLRKKKGIEINAQRQIMSDELKVIRREMKKLRKKQRKGFYKTTNSNENNDFIPLTKCTDIKLEKNTLNKKGKRNSKTKNFKKSNRSY